MQNRAMQKWAAQLRSCRYWTREQARDVLDKQRASGEGITLFARSMGFVPQRLFWWQARLRLPSEHPQPATQAFVPVVVRTDASDRRGRISVELGDGVRLDVHEVDASTAGWVALVLSSRGQL